MTKIEEIYAAALPEMKALDIEDTTENRIIFLQGLYDAWEEDEEVNIEKTFWMLALHTEIMSLKLKWQFPRIMG